MPDLVLCSTARRARETWELAEPELGASPAVSYDQRVYGATTAGLLALARQAPAETRALLIVGHDPAIQALTLELAGLGERPGEGEPGALARVRVKFPTAAIAVLAWDGPWPELDPGRARLVSFARPADFRS